MANQMTNTVHKVISGSLPVDINLLRDDAKNENFNFIERLYVEWTENRNRFDKKGEMLICSFVNRQIAGLGGITVDPAIADALRMRRFYIRPAFRRLGLGKLLCETLIENARPSGKRITVCLLYTSDAADD